MPPQIRHSIAAGELNKRGLRFIVERETELLVAEELIRQFRKPGCIESTGSGDTAQQLTRNRDVSQVAEGKWQEQLAERQASDGGLSTAVQT